MRGAREVTQSVPSLQTRYKSHVHSSLFQLSSPGMPDEVLTDNGDGDSRWADVLLSTGVDDSILGDIHRLGDKV